MNSGTRLSLDKLRGRSLAELGLRGAQLLSALGERVGAGDTREPSAQALYAALTAAERRRHASFEAWLRAFRERDGEGFFAGTDQLMETARLSREIDADGVARVIDRANCALQGRLTLLGHQDLIVGPEINWHRDPLRGVTAPRRHWSRIPYLDASIAGDHKVLWEINRHQWLVTLAQGWVYTGDDRYVAAIAGALQSWMDANPPKLGVNWASSLEVAFRTISWVWLLRIVGRHPSLSDALIARVIGHLRIAGRHIARHLSTYFSANTHLTGEALALYYLGGELAGFKEARRWRDTGRRILLEQLPIHVRSDGTYFEQTTWYHRYTLDFYLHFCILEQRAGRDTAPLRSALDRLAGVLLWIMRPDGTMPLIGDDDGGRLLALDGRTARDPRPALANVAALLGDSTLASAGPPSAELPWLLGASGVAAHRSLTPHPPYATSRHFSGGGLVVLRDGWDAKASVMTLDVGEHGVMKGGHSHADALSFDLTVRGVPVFVDPGTCDYTTDPETRDRFRHTAAHNAATVDGHASSEMAGPFAWGATANTTLSRFVTTPVADYVDASHDGYVGHPVRASYRRQWLFLHHGLWIVRDSLTADQACVMAVHLQCAAGISVVAHGRNVRLASLGSDRATLHFADEGASLDVMAGVVSPLYGAQEVAPHLMISHRPAVHQVIHTLVANADLGVTNVRVSNHGNASVLEITRNGEVDLVGFGDGSLLRHDDASADADAWWVRRGAGRRVIQWMVARARTMQLDGVELVSSVDGTDAWEDAEPLVGSGETR